ncbi:type II toxin-antitoxin system HicB family antitoxin [Actinokineospora sp.]|uniref:type II toxin-antitoxin system HicB family antitoxin n=1 Tax=Actinokineospora sp. TaxID=1872133 RepID=UPI004037B009
MSSYVIIIERAEDGGFGAWCPDLPGCVALADSYDETVVEMQKAIAFHLRGMRANGEPVPPPSAIGATTVDAA